MTNDVHDGSFPLSVPVSHAREPTCIIPGPLNLNGMEVINYTCARPAATCQNICCEKGLCTLNKCKQQLVRVCVYVCVFWG